MPTLQPGSTSQAFDVDIGQTVSATPGSGGTMLVEYTTNSEIDIRNGSATWQAWTAGTVSSAASDVAMCPLFARVTAYTAAGQYDLSGSGLRAVPSQYLAWKSDVVSARDLASATAVVSAGRGAASARLRGQAYVLAQARNPFDMRVYGDSTGDETTEWPYLLTQLFSTGIASSYGVAYRAWSDARQQYATIQYLTNGPLGRRYISAGSATTSHRIEVGYSSASSDLTVIAEVDLMGGSPSSQFAIAAKFGGAGARSWRLELTTGNALFFEHSNDGTAQINRTSSALSAGVLNGGRVFLRVQLDIDNGAAGNTCTFSYSYDRSTWTTIGSPDVKAGTTTLFDTATTLQLIGRGGGSISSLGKDFRFYSLEVFASLDESAMRSSIDCGSVPQRSSMTSIAYKDDTGAAGTIYFQGSTVVGSPRLCMFNGSVGGQVIAYAIDAGGGNARFAKLNSGGQGITYISYSHNEGTDVTYRADYKALTDLIVAANPDEGIIGVLQNKRYSPAANIEEHEIRKQQIAAFCSAQGFDTFNMASYVSQSQMKADGIHPDPATGVMDTIAAAAYAQIRAGAVGSSF